MDGGVYGRAPVVDLEHLNFGLVCGALVALLEKRCIKCELTFQHMVFSRMHLPRNAISSFFFL